MSPVDDDGWPHSALDVIKSFSYFSNLTGDDVAEFKGKVIERVNAITARHTAIDRNSKLNRLRVGLLPNATKFKSMVDLRPDFSSDRMAINGLVPVVQVQVTTDSSSPDKVLLFQMSPKRFEDLERLVSDIKLKLERISTESVLSGLLIDNNNASGEAKK